MVKEPTDNFNGNDRAESWLISSTPWFEYAAKASNVLRSCSRVFHHRIATQWANISLLSKVKSHDNLKNGLATGVRNFVGFPADYDYQDSYSGSEFGDYARFALHSHQFDMLDENGLVLLHVNSLHGDDDAEEYSHANEFHPYISSFYDGQPIPEPPERKEMLGVDGEALEGEALKSFEHNLRLSGQ